MSNASSCGSELYRPYAPSFPIVTSRGVSSEDTLIERRIKHQAPSYFQFKSPSKTTGGEDPERRNKDVEGGSSWSWWHQPTRPVDPDGGEPLRYLAEVERGPHEDVYPFDLSTDELGCLLGYMPLDDERRLAFVDLRDRYMAVEEERGLPQQMMNERDVLDEILLTTFRELTSGTTPLEELRVLVSISIAFYQATLITLGRDFEPSKNYLTPWLPLEACEPPREEQIANLARVELDRVFGHAKPSKGIYVERRMGEWCTYATRLGDDAPRCPNCNEPHRLPTTEERLALIFEVQAFAENEAGELRRMGVRSRRDEFAAIKGMTAEVWAEHRSKMSSEFGGADVSLAKKYRMSIPKVASMGRPRKPQIISPLTAELLCVLERISVPSSRGKLHATLNWLGYSIDIDARRVEKLEALDGEVLEFLAVYPGEASVAIIKKALRKRDRAIRESLRRLDQNGVIECFQIGKWDRFKLAANSQG